MLTIHNLSNQLFNCTSHFFGILVINCYDDIRRFPGAVTPDTVTVVNVTELFRYKFTMGNIHGCVKKKKETVHDI